jgi:molybdate transport system substrate-binding protein
MGTTRANIPGPRRAGLITMLLVLVLAGCSKAAPRAGEPNNGERLLIAAASDLQAALPEAIAEFRRSAPEIKIEPAFESSGHLAEQIKAGAPFDLFLAANEKFVDDLAAAGAVDRESVRPYAVGSLVLAVNGKSSGVVTKLEDLTRREVKKIAMGNPATAPYGAAARQALTRAGLWEALEPKIVIASSVRQALQFVQTGNAEAGLVGRATADVPEVQVVEVDRALYDPIVQALGVVARSPRKAEAARFVNFLLSREGQTVLASFGFRPPSRPQRATEPAPPPAPASTAP